MANRYQVAWRDYANKRVEVTLPVEATKTSADLAGFASALEAYLIGAGGGAGFIDEISADNKTRATDPEAQAKHLLAIEVTDTVTGNIHTYRFPCVDLTIADDGSLNEAFTTQQGVTVANPSHALYAPLKAVIESDILSKAENPVTLSRIYVDGR